MDREYYIAPGSTTPHQGSAYKTISDLILESIILHPFQQWFKLFRKSLLSLLGLFACVELESLFGSVLELFTIKLWQRLNAVLVNSLNQVENLRVQHSTNWCVIKLQELFSTNNNTYKSIAVARNRTMQHVFAYNQFVMWFRSWISTGLENIKLNIRCNQSLHKRRCECETINK